MTRAFRLDWLMLRPRIAPMTWLMVVICLWLTFQMRTFPGMYAAAIFMAYPMTAMSLGSYDDSKGWNAVRLTMPVSRRDVVAGRYLTMAVLAAGSILIALGVTALLLGAEAAYTAFLPDATPFLPNELTMAGMPQATLVVTCLTLLVTTVMVAVVTPLNFRFGMTRVTTILPYVFILATLAGIALVGEASGNIMDSAPGLFDWLATTTGAVIASAILLALATVIMAVSAICSTIVYDHREM